MSGFSSAPVTKGLMLFAGISSVGVGLLHWKPYMPLILDPHITTHHQFWRILVQPLAYVNSSELLLFELLMYATARQVERRLGSIKFAAYLLLTHLLTMALSLLTLLLIHPVRRAGSASPSIPALASSPWNTLHPGPTSIAISVLFLWHRLVPSVYTWTLAGIDFSDKIYPFILASQLIIPHFPLPIPILTALFASHMVLLSPPQTASTPTKSLLDSFTFPLPLTRFAESYLLPLIGSLREPKRSTNAWPLEEVTPPPGTASPAGEHYFRSTILGRRALTVATGAMPTVPAAAPPAAPAAPATQTTAAVEPPTGASVVSQWVDELTARGSAPRAPTEDEVRVLQTMFPSITRARIVRALQQSDFDQGRAVDMLLVEDET